MRRVPTALSVLLLLAAAAGFAQPVQQTSGKVLGVSVPLELSEQFLGTSAGRTVVRFTISFSRTDLREKAGLAPRVYPFFVVGEARSASGEVVDAFREPVDVDLSDAELGKALRASFLRALPPGSTTLGLRLEAENGRSMGLRSVTFDVPKMTSEFRADDAGPLTAPAILLEEKNREDVPSGDLIRFLPPQREVPVGLLRIECEVKPPISRVEFHLGDKLILARNRPPFTVEIDLGTIPRKQTLRALGFDRLGNFVDADAWALNEKEARLAVRVLDLPKAKGKADSDVKVAVQSIAGAVAKRVALFLDEKKVAEWTAPPYRASVAAAEVEKATLMRASAWDAEGKEYSDFRMLKGDERLLAKVDVNLVELNVSVFDEAGRFAKGLTKDDFTVLEDGAVQDLSAFEFAESLPMALGLVLDGSGSMDKSMPLVKQAATEFVSNLVGEKDQGFVIEFRERPTLLAPMTSNRASLIRAIGETRAGGATAFHDSVILGLYQFRSLAGKKALVVLTDGKDNHSSTDWPTLKRYARTAGVPIFVVGLDLGLFDVGLKSRLKELAEDTGGETFFIGGAKELAGVYRKIEAEVRSQYFLSYLTESKRKDDEFRTVEVKLARPGLRAKTIRGYFP
ncbi:MAG TPA: VWA domain-containing protein [Thermoanaerobaculia bacterium]|nr:VWA domain-containing protein [Thermoanaerobaculia bacterium]